MSAAFSSSSSSSIITLPSNYEVFISFRGETRENFTSHLFAALCRKKIHTFMDEVISKGDKISQDLLNAMIEGSKISVIVLSEDYASSEWCLDELNKILECKEKSGQIVIPVFYHVHPFDVRQQTGNLEKAFGEIEKTFKKMPDKVQKWRDALTEASFLVGHESAKIRPDARLVDVIVKDVLKKLEDITVSTDANGLVGINSRIEQVKSLLCIGLPIFQIVGIWGMGGIGKTTLAEAIFNRISKEFESKSFMANIREESERYGLNYLRARVLSEILEEDIKIQTLNLPRYIKERLRRMKVLIILDDVNKLEQLNYLAGGLDGFGAGSRIIVTTRDKHVLEKFGVGYIYKVEGLNYHDSLEHFNNYAFRENQPLEDFLSLSKRVLDHAKGNPLALKVLGSFFCGKSKQDWENAMENLKLIPDPDIYDVMKISYNYLSLEVKNIFLDIACFFRGDEKDHVIAIFNDSYSIHSGLNILIDKSLITISDNKLEIHDLLQEMGREIIRRESIEEPEKRSRLWYHMDILRILNKNKGTDSIKGISLNLSKIIDINLDSRAFANMSNLRLLKFYMPQHSNVLDMRCKVHLPQGLQYLSDELRYLHWHGYPLRMLPKNFNPNYLIELSLPCSKIEQLWKEKKKAPELKYIDLQHSQYVTRIPDILEAPKLERVNLLNCRNLSCIPSSIQKFSNLGHLSLSGCTSLQFFPSNIHFTSPISIDFSECVNLTEFPQLSGKITGLYLRRTSIEEVPSSIESLTDLETLDMRDCKRLKILSTSICKLKSLHWLILAECSKLETFPEILEKMYRLERIDLESTAIKELPSSIENVEGLKSLVLRKCSELHNLPPNLWNLKSLNVVSAMESGVSQLPSSIIDLNKIEAIWLSGCRGLVLPYSLSGFSSLTDLMLDDCCLTEIPDDIGCLSSLQRLNLKGNNFYSLPQSLKDLSKLEQLIVSKCNMLQSLPELPVGFEVLEARDCKQLQSFPELPSPLEEFDASVLELLFKHCYNGFAECRQTLDFCNCMKLKENADKNILADSQRRIQHMAIASLRQFYEKWNMDSQRSPELGGFSICSPGSRIPDWFSNQSSGSSIIIPLPQICCDRNFIGFALCAVIAFEKALHDTHLFGVKCKYRFENKHVDREFWLKGTWLGVEKDFLYDSDHICLGFDPCLLNDHGHHTTVSFEFSISVLLDEHKETAKVKFCGVSPFYAHPIETQPNTFTVTTEPPTEHECRKLHNESNDETGTSRSIGRSAKEEINAPQQQSSFLSRICCCLGLD